MRCWAPDQSTQKYPFNEKIAFGAILFVFVLISKLEYIHCSRCQRSYGIDGMLLWDLCDYNRIYWFLVIAFNRVELFENIDRIEQLIDTSIADQKACYLRLFRSTISIQFSGYKYQKSKELYLATSRQVERLSDFVFTLMMKVALQCYM